MPNNVVMARLISLHKSPAGRVSGRDSSLPGQDVARQTEVAGALLIVSNVCELLSNSAHTDEAGRNSWGA
jgi:hypothetical protein